MNAPDKIPCGTRSYWMEAGELSPVHEITSRSQEIDVCVVGAGIAGLTTAYLLLQEGRTVAIMDDGAIAAGETARTTAHITYVLDSRYSELQRLHGKEKTQVVLESHNAAIDEIEAIVKGEGIECDFQRVDGYLFLGENQSAGILNTELSAMHDFGYQGVSQIGVLPWGLGRPALRFPRQAQFHVLKYLYGLTQAIEKMGGLVFCGRHVAEIKDGKPAQVITTDGQSLSARAVVVATNSPVSDLLKLHTKQAAYRTFVIAGSMPSASLAAAQPALYWDTEDPYHYMRFQTVSPDKVLVILGGEDHRTGEFNDAEKRFARLENWLLARVPEVEAIAWRWSGQVYEPIDGVGFIGKDPAHGENVFLSSGSSGNGMTHGTISGMILRDLICGRSNPWAQVYDPGRKPVKAAIEFVKENLNTAAQYAKNLQPGERRSVEDIPAGEGAVMRCGLKQVAVYKSDSGEVCSVSAICKHLGNTVSWNSCEKSWDCAAHGSRYDVSGRVLNGPANADLDKADLEQAGGQETMKRKAG